MKTLHSASCLCVAILIALSVSAASAQRYDLLIRGGHVIDPGNGIDAVRDVAVSGDHIAAVEARIPAAQATRVVEATGYYVVPGLVDLHMHVFGYHGSISADENALPAGTTTIVDAGGSGWRTFDTFRSTVIASAKTRVLVLINIVGKGMIGEPYESDTEDMDAARTADTILRNRDVIVGIKTAHFNKPGWTAIDRAVEAGRKANVPVMVDDRIFVFTGRTSKDELLEHLRPGDIHTHMYNDRQIELVDRFTAKVQPWMLAARERGVLFDVGHGGGSFLWTVATPAIAQGFWPDTISTDLHEGSRYIQQSTMPNVMSKLMLLGMSLNDVLERSTVNPARAIGRYPELGTLGVGHAADIAVLQERTGVFAFKDSWPAKRLGTKLLECVLTVRAGKVVYERGAAPPPETDLEIYDLLFKHARIDDRAEDVDVAIMGDRIARIAHGLKASHARTVVEAEGYQFAPGPIAEGAAADLTLMDSGRAILILKAGQVATDDLGLTIPDTIRAGPYSNFK